MKKNKILFLGRFYFPPLGGGEFFISAVLNYLKKQGYECSAACYADPSNEKRFTERKKVEWLGIEVDQIPVNQPRDFIAYLDEKKPDVVITQSFDALYIVRSAHILGIKTILGTHFWRNICAVEDNFMNMMDRSLSSVKLLKNLHPVFKESDESYVNSEFMQKAVERFVGIHIGNIIYPISDLGRVKCEETDPKYITIINPDFGKGGDVFLEIAASMKNVEFLCVGKGNEFFPENKNINNSLDLAPNIKVIENTDDISSVYEKTKILLIPSKVDETFCMVALEAMINGIPIIYSNRGNLPFLIGDAGVCLSECSPNLWIECICNLLEKESIIDEMSRESIKKSSEYSVEKEMKKFEGLVEKCL